MTDDPRRTLPHYGDIVPYIPDRIDHEDVSHAARKRIVARLRTELDATVCVRCRRNFFQCRCTLKELHDYIDKTPLKIRYGPD